MSQTEAYAERLETAAAALADPIDPGDFALAVETLTAIKGLGNSGDPAKLARVALAAIERRSARRREDSRMAFLGAHMACSLCSGEDMP